jgi:Fe(3+) dicitrate transport protein
MDTLLNEAVPEELSQGRSILLAGLGLGYRLGNHSELYANFSQNYRAINFNDLRILNPNQEVDPKLKDERGFNADFGFRGQWRKHLRYDLSLFYLQYQNRIGNLRMQRPDPENPYIIQVYNLRTNIGNARVLGLESVVELHLLKGLLGASKDWEAQVFVNFAYLDGRYTQTENSFTRNKKLELVAPLTLKTGFSLSYKSLRLSYQYNYTQAHYSDATNAESSANAVVGLIPSYQVMDLSLSYEWRSLKLQLGSNNLSNERYFTRRASSYPGPGILPGEARSFYLSLQYVFEP